jgi:hypothetical protein
MSPYDKEVYDAGFKYIPQSQYLLNPFKIPVPESKSEDTSSGIPTLIPRDSGDGFNPYNTNMSNVRQDFNPYEARQAEEIYSRTFNPQPYGTGVESAQAAYNQANKALALGMDPNSPGYGSFTGGKLTGLKDIANEIIMNNKEQYGAQGQYVNPYDPNYSSMEEAQKFMAHPLFEKYYGVNEKGVQLPGILGVGLEFLKRKMPINERAIMENEARGAGIFTDDIGRIVTDDYNTAGGIMAGYNLNKIDAGTFDKRRSTIEKTIADKKAKGLDTTVLEERLGLLDEAEAEILGARKKTDLIYKMRKDKKDTYEKRKKEEKAAAATTTAAKTTDVKDTSGGYAGTPGGNTGDPGGNFANIDNSGKNYGPYSKPSPAPQYTSQDDTRESRRGRYFYGGRVNFKNGGLASIL